MTGDPLKRAQDVALARLNTREPQFPPDIAYIKSDRARLQAYLDDNARVKQILERATPRYKHRFKHFQMRQADADLMRERELAAQAVQLSSKDSFLQGGYLQREYLPIHRGVQKTQDLLDMIQPAKSGRIKSPQQEASPRTPATRRKREVIAVGDTADENEISPQAQDQIESQQKKKTTPNALQAWSPGSHPDILTKINYNDTRFYTRARLPEEALIQSLKKLMEKHQVSKHVKARRDPIEAPKLAAIERDLAPSTHLKTVEVDEDDFENQTNREFNRFMAVDQRETLQKNAIWRDQEMKRRRSVGLQLEPLSPMKIALATIVDPPSAFTCVRGQISPEGTVGAALQTLQTVQSDFRFTKRSLPPVLSINRLLPSFSRQKIQFKRNIQLPNLQTQTSDLKSKQMRALDLSRTAAPSSIKWQETSTRSLTTVQGTNVSGGYLSGVVSSQAVEQPKSLFRT